MAKFVLSTVTIEVGAAWTGTAPGSGSTPSGTITSGTDISAMVTAAEFTMDADEIDATSFGTDGWRSKITGLANCSLSLTFHNDYASGQTDALFGLGGTFGFAPGQSTPYYIDIKPTSASRSATNPSYVAAFLNAGGSPITGSVGDLAVVTYSFPCTGVPGRLTS